MWVYSHNGHKVGPVTFEEIVNQIHAGVIIQSTAVCCSGEKPCRAGHHPKLQPYFASMNNSTGNIATDSQEFSISSDTSSGSENQTSPFPQFQFPSSPSGHTKSKQRMKSKQRKSKNSKKNNDFRKGLVVILCCCCCCLFSLFLPEDESEKLFNQGMEYLEENENAKAIECWKKAAELGHPHAYYALGLNYAIPEPGKPRDMVEAAKWYLKGAKLGDAPSQVAIGQCYENGEGVTKNINEAAEWYRKAADQGNADGQRLLAIAYLYGRGVPKNINKAKILAQQAADQGDEKAIILLNLINRNVKFI